MASSAILLLRSAAREAGRDGEAAKTFIARASCLIQLEADRSVIPSRDVGAGVLTPCQEWRVKAFIDEQLTGQIHVEDLSRLLNPSKSGFTRSLRRSLSEAPHGYIVIRRLNQARRIMLIPDMVLSQLAVACGVSDQAHFCRLFRRATGDSPAA